MAYGCCLLNLRLPAGAVRVAAPAACASAPRSVAVFDLCIAVMGTGLDTVRVVLDKVVDIIAEIRVGFSVVTPVAVLLIQVLVCTETQCRECVQKNSLSSGRWFSAGPPWGNCASRSSSAAWHASI